MSAQQTSYSLERSAGYEGQLYDTRDIRSDARRNDFAASAEAPFGKMVCKSTDSDDLGMAGANATTQVLGVLIHSMDTEQSTTGLLATEFGNVASKCTVWVRPVHNVTTVTPVRVFVVDYTGTTTGAVVGAFGTTAVSAKTSLPLLNCRYLRAASAGDLVPVEINIPGPLVLGVES